MIKKIEVTTFYGMTAAKWLFYALFFAAFMVPLCSLSAFAQQGWADLDSEQESPKSSQADEDQDQKSIKVTSKKNKAQQKRPLKRLKSSKLEGFHQKSWMGLGFFLSQTRQASRKVASSSDSSFIISDTSGTAPFFGLTGSFPLGQSFAIMVSAFRRKIEMSGTVTIGTSSPTSFFLEQTGWGTNLTGKFYPGGRSGNFWAGVGLDVCKVDESKLTYGTGVVAQEGDQALPTNVMIQASTGVDFEIFRSFILHPDLRIGYVASTTPAILSLEVQVGLGYQF